MTTASKQPLEGERGKTFKVDPDSILIPPPGHFLHDPTSPTTASPALVRKIESVGWFGVATVTKLDSEVYVLLGRDRTLAVREVNRKRGAAGEPPITIEVQYRTCPDAATAVRMMIAENKGRRTMTQATDARYALMLKDSGLTLEMVAEELEVSVATIRGYLKLADQPAFVLAAVTKGEISVAKARQLVGTNEEKREAVKAAKDKGGAGAGKGRKRDPKAWTKILKEHGVTEETWKALNAAWRAL